MSFTDTFTEVPYGNHVIQYVTYIPSEFNPNNATGMKGEAIHLTYPAGMTNTVEVEKDTTFFTGPFVTGDATLLSNIHHRQKWIQAYSDTAKLTTNTGDRLVHHLMPSFISRCLGVPVGEVGKRKERKNEAGTQNLKMHMAAAGVFGAVVPHEGSTGVAVWLHAVEGRQPMGAYKPLTIVGKKGFGSEEGLYVEEQESWMPPIQNLYSNTNSTVFRVCIAFINGDIQEAVGNELAQIHNQDLEDELIAYSRSGFETFTEAGLEVPRSNRAWANDELRQLRRVALKLDDICSEIQGADQHMGIGVSFRVIKKSS
jgi:hypothetical protein